MASIIRIKRSSVSGNPNTLAAGELAYSALPDNGSNGGDRLYIGIGTETAGNAANHFVIGGKYFTDMLDHTRGALTASSALIVDADSKLDNLKVDNIDINGNTISTTNSGGNLVLDPNGTGKVAIGSAYTLPKIDASSGYVITTDGAGSSTFKPITDSLSITGGTTIDVAVSSANNITIGTKAITLGTSTLNNGATTTTLAGLQQLDVDNIRIDGNTISSTNDNGNIVLDPNGTGVIDASSTRITNLAEPTADSDAATKYYVDAARSGLDVKASVRAATTANLTSLSGLLTIDTITLLEGDRVLVKDQTAGEDNGIYVASSGAWTRATDADNNPGGEVTSGMFTFVEAGDVNLNCGFVLTTTGTITLGTTPLTFTLFSASGSLLAGDGLTKVGNQLNVVGTADRITVNANNVDIASTYVGQSSITTLGTITTGTWSATTIAEIRGGTGQSTYATGDILYASATNTLSKLSAGTEGKVLQINASGVPVWADVDGGTY